MKIHMDNFVSFPRMTVRDRSGEHRPFNKRYAPRDSWADLEVYVGPAVNRYLNIMMAEGCTTDAGHPSSRTVSMILSEEHGRALLAFLQERYR